MENGDKTTEIRQFPHLGFFTDKQSLDNILQEEGKDIKDPSRVDLGIVQPSGHMRTVRHLNFPTYMFSDLWIDILAKANWMNPLELFLFVKMYRWNLTSFISNLVKSSIHCGEGGKKQGCMMHPESQMTWTRFRLLFLSNGRSRTRITFFFVLSWFFEGTGYGRVSWLLEVIHWRLWRGCSQCHPGTWIL